MRIYIAGPMRKIPHYNFPAFDEAAKTLRERGHDVVSPADLDRAIGFDGMDCKPGTAWDYEQADFDLGDCFDRDIEAIRSCEAIYLLPGWEDSKGCKMEKAVAEFLGMQVLTAGPPRLVDVKGVRVHEAEMKKGQAVYWSDPWVEDDVRVLAATEVQGIDPTKPAKWKNVSMGILNPLPDPLPTDSAERKTYPIYSGFMAYFPRAIAAVAHHSYLNNEKHNPGEPLYWSKEKSSDHRDCMGRHMIEQDRVSAAWRAMADLEIFLEGGQL